MNRTIAEVSAIRPSHTSSGVVSHSIPLPFRHRLASVFTSFWRHRHLILQMTKRDVVGRYRGSLLGLAWSFLTPLIMLAVYTFLFGVVFKARWGAGRAKPSSISRSSCS